MAQGLGALRRHSRRREIQKTGHPYLYANGNPTTLSDPNGLEPIDSRGAKGDTCRSFGYGCGSYWAGQTLGDTNGVYLQYHEASGWDSCYTTCQSMKITNEARKTQLDGAWVLGGLLCVLVCPAIAAAVAATASAVATAAASCAATPFLCKLVVADAGTAAAKFGLDLVDDSTPGTPAGGKQATRWVDDAGNIRWSLNKGFASTPVDDVLEVGTKVDRYGKPGGGFVSPVGTPYGARSLAPGTNAASLRTYEVLKPIEGVKTGQIAPWFDEVGLGVQHELPESVQWLTDNGYLKEIP
jgi:hypothetical protein